MRNSFTFAVDISLYNGPVMYVAALISSECASSKPLGRILSCCF